MIDSALVSSYANANAKYIVELDNSQVRITVGKMSAVIDKLLVKHKASSSFFITPENPFSLSLSDAENKLRHQRFVAILKQNKYDYYAGFGTDENETWPREISYLNICNNKSAMHHLAGQFGQNGLLQISKDKKVSLYILSPPVYTETG